MLWSRDSSRHRKCNWLQYSLKFIVNYFIHFFLFHTQCAALISSQLELHRFATGRQPRVVAALTMLKQMLFRYQGHVSAALILGGVDIDGPHLHTVYPHGSTDTLPYVAMGSGSLAAMAVLERGYKRDLTEQEAIDLIKDSIRAGIFNDLGSGSNVNIRVIKKDSTTNLHNYDTPNPRLFRREGGYPFPRGYTDVISQSVELFNHNIEIEEVVTPMEI